MWKAPECDYPDYDFHTRLARESYCNSGMERHYAGAHPDYDFHGMTTLLDVELKAQGEERDEEAKNRLKHEVAKCVSIGLYVDQTCAILVFLTYQ